MPQTHHGHVASNQQPVQRGDSDNPTKRPEAEQLNSDRTITR
jgi:hypothetical protein